MRGDSNKLVVEKMSAISWWSAAGGEGEEEARAMEEVEAGKGVAARRPDMGRRAAARIERAPRRRDAGAASQRGSSPPPHGCDSGKDAVGGREGSQVASSTAGEWGGWRGERTNDGQARAPLQNRST